MRRDEYVVTPEGWLSRGDAFVSGRGGQLSIFGAIPGERAKVRVFDRVHQQDRARWLGSDAPSPRRVTPPCARWGRCGGCPWMHLDAEGQAGAHRELLLAALSEAGVEVPVRPLVASAPADVLHALDLVAGWSDERHFRLGMPAREGRGVVPIPDCLKVTAELRGLMTVAAWEFLDHHVRPGAELVGMRAAQAEGILVTILATRPAPVFAEVAARLGARIPEVRGVLARVPDGHSRRLYGDDALETKLAGLRFRLGPDELPAHPALTDRMLVDLVAELGVAEGDAIVDVGAGIGLRTCVLARASGWAFGLEADPATISRARENASRAEVTAEFVPGSPVAELQDARPRLLGRRPLVHADLGRKALDDDLFAELLALDPRRVAFTSGNPRALARELGRWLLRGWHAEGITPYDVGVHGPLGLAVGVISSPDQSSPEKRAPRRRRVRDSP